MPAPQIEVQSLQLQERDFDLLHGLFQSRVMTLGHIATLYFDGKGEYAKKRLQKLKAAGLVSERKRRVNEPSILILARKAFDLLRSQGRIAQYPAFGAHSFEARAKVSDLTLRHEIEVMDVKAALHAALAASQTFSILEFLTWPLLCQFQTARSIPGPDILVKPDGFMRIHEKEPGTKGFAYDCFLEVDRSSEVQDTLVAKADCYRTYYKSGGFAVRNGGSATDFKGFPFRVLIVLKSVERRNNTAERLANNDPPILGRTWLTTIEEITSDPLGPIWIRPMDYRNVIMGTPFYNERPSSRFEYRRQSERDNFVESKIKKRHLFEGKAVTEDPNIHRQEQRSPHHGKA